MYQLHLETYVNAFVITVLNVTTKFLAINGVTYSKHIGSFIRVEIS